ncbi:ROK family protein [Ancylomarina sp. 16SWW S1-10-2]|uniref:ROK family protein n=1 Tax=Ancylomarina sp. 16SWW S1-10-2 TaxID=2499681 RepID=UPI0012AE5638|nr:ROK family protein [Ancylomarina sp. 16SWW S1-10-2]MRT93817.1 ROK family protein [Ancylomarina sp. 16SWW S1-10-2]
MKKYAIGTDVGGSHISCALVDLEKGELVEGTHNEGDVDNKADEDTILKGWASVLAKSLSAINKDELAGIGFGMPGPFEYENGIGRFAQVDKYESLNGVDVASKLKVILELDDSTPLRFMNDASAFAVGEAWLGSAGDVDKSMSITLGTGFGSAFVASGIPVVEGDEVPKLGCVWHLPYADGIADDSFSTRWFIKRYKEETGLDVSGARPIAEAADTNPKAAEIFNQYGSNMGEFLGPWLKKFDAKVLVMGGNVVGAYNLFGPAFEAALKLQGVNTRIELSSLKEDAAIIGSARMLDSEYWNTIKATIPKM